LIEERINKPLIYSVNVL